MSTQGKYLTSGQIVVHGQRGYPLVITSIVPGCGLLTVELASKWYELYLVKLAGDARVGIYELESFHFGHLEPFSRDGSYFVDHCPNPRAVAAFAASKGYSLDDCAYELLVGRWELEVKGWAERMASDAPKKRFWLATDPRDRHRWNVDVPSIDSLKALRTGDLFLGTRARVSSTDKVFVLQELAGDYPFDGYTAIPAQD